MADKKIPFKIKVEREDKTEQLEPSDNNEKTKKPIYKKWWFWLIIALVFLAGIGSLGDDDETGTSTTTSTTKVEAEAETTTKKVYSVPNGANVENNGDGWGLYQDGVLIDGYTGIASNANGDWYIANGMVDFSYNGTYKQGLTEYQVTNGKAAKVVNGTTAAPKMSKEEYKAKCENYNYEDLARNPDNYKQKYVHFYGKVVQVQDSTFLGTTTTTLRVATSKSDYGSWLDDIVWVTYTKKEGESNILEDDFVNIYGLYDGTESYTAVLGNTITIPAVKAEYIDLAQ